MQTIKDFANSTLAENFGGAVGGQNKAASGDQQFSIDAVPDLTDKVFVITGGSQGIGYGCVYTYLKNNAAKVIALSPSKENNDNARKELAKELGEDKASRYHYVPMDLSDWQGVTDAAKEVRKLTDHIDSLVLNAGRGIMTAQLTDKGVDRHMAMNHIAHVILTSHLLPVLKKSAEKGPVRIGLQASNAHQGAPSGTKFESLEEINKDAGPNGQYGRSKLAVILYARYLARHLSKSHPSILVNATHPGFVRTHMSTEDIHEPFPILGYGMSTLMAPFQKDQYEGAVSLLYATTAVEKTGLYICPPAIEEQGSSQSQDEALGEQLMKLTVQIVQEKFPGARSNGCPFLTY